MRIAVLGATGVLGRNVIPRFVAAGHEVIAAVRNDHGARLVQNFGAKAKRGDILDAASLPSIVTGCDAALHLATAIPKPGPKMDWSLNDRIRTDGTRNLIRACQAENVRRYVQQSIAMMLGGSNEWRDEDGPVLADHPVYRSSVEMERLVRDSDLDWRIARGGLFYGPGTGREEMYRTALANGELRLPGDGSAYVSLIHVADMAAAVVAATLAPTSRLTVNVVDDHPPTYAELFGFLAAQANVPPAPPGGPPGMASFRVGNQLAKQRLGWRPFYPDYRVGLA
ncbi:MAG: NAD-dependent epimerase/dehydratase family protein [Alphaproteobacteria bacterium]